MLARLSCRSVASCSSVCTRRGISTTFSRHAEAPDATAVSEEPSERQSNRRGKAGQDYFSWIQDPVGGLPYQHPDAPKKWLGGNVPFPLNPSFRPPTPVSNVMRDAIYKEFMENPRKNNVRVLAQRYHLSIKRVDAILRLKGLEANWVEKKQLQTGFNHGMEYILGISRQQEEDKLRRMKDRHSQYKDFARFDVFEADQLDAEQGDEMARHRYQRMFWEPVPSNEEPKMPGILKRAQDEAAEARKAAQESKSDAKYVGQHDDASGKAPKVWLSYKEGHLPIKITDVGGKFLDVKEVERRRVNTSRRLRRKEKSRI